jgi:hypothetical protein
LNVGVILTWSARYNTEGLPASLCEKKISTMWIDGSTHSQKDGITQDPRTVLNVLSVLLDLELEKPKQNFGFIFKKT